MKSLTVYEANDGSRWDTPAQASERDELLAAVEAAMQPLGKHDDGCAFVNGAGYYQHTQEACDAARNGLWSLTRRPLELWIANQREKYGTTEDEVSKCHPSWFLRMLDGSCPPLEKAWSRFYCMDDQCREWGQPYYASHQNEAQQVCLNGKADN